MEKALLNENKKFIIKLAILLVVAIIFAVLMNYYCTFYEEGKNAFCTGKFPNNFCVDKMKKPISGIVYNTNGVVFLYKDGKVQKQTNKEENK